MNIDLEILPSELKRELCLDLLSELGVDNVTEKGDELIHGCVVSGYHTNQDKSPTGSLNYEKLVYLCLGCQAAGGLVWYVSMVLGVDRKEARKWITTRTGGEDQTSMLLKFYDAMYAGKKKHKEPIPTFDERMISRWETDTHPYIGQRGITPENARLFRLGFDTDKNGLVIPHFFKGKLTGWQTRYLQGDIKYKSTPSFPKARTLFNYQPRADSVVVVEAPISVVKHEGEHHWEATVGANTTEEQIQLLQKHSRIILWMDNDAAGWKATHHMAKVLMASSDVWVVDSPIAGDPGDLPTEMVNKLVRNLVVPYAVWKPPTLMMCAGCLQFQDECAC